MTEDNGGSVGIPSHDEDKPAQHGPANASAGESGFAPPDGPEGHGRPAQPGTADRLLVPGHGEQPNGPGQARPPRPGFVPHNHDPNQNPAPPYNWPPQQQPPGPATTPYGTPRPPGPGAPMPGSFGGPGGGGPNWAPAPAPPAPARRGPGLGVLAIVALVAALVAGVVGAGVGVMATGGGTASGGSVDLGGTSSGPGGKSRPAGTVAGVAQRLLPSVVMIKVQGANGESGAGTGFVVRDGYIMTNNHVVAPTVGGGSLQVVFNDQRTTSATVVGRDPSSDVAVLKPATTNRLPALQLGNSDDIAVGDSVIAIGSPLGLQGSVTTGIVSSVNRAVPTNGGGGGSGGGTDSSVLNAIQTDAAINPGNSGGPLVDAQGRVIGMNTAIATLGGGGLGAQGQSGSIGLGFAIPVNQAKRVGEQIINKGKATHAKIGATMDLQYQGTGVRISQSAQAGQDPVTKNGPADKAGLKPGDIISSFDGKPVGGPTDLLALIRSHVPGDKVKLTFKRGSSQSTVDVTLGEAN